MTGPARRLWRWLAVAALFLVTAAVTVVPLGDRGGSRGSTISRGPGGWLAARRYLQARGARVTLISEPLARYVQEQSVEPVEAGEPGRSLELRDRSARGEPGQPIAPLPPRRPAGPGVLALVFPWQALPAADLEEPIEAHLGRGGDVVLAYSGEAAGAERVLDVWRWERAGEVPLAPWRWWSFTHREWQLRPAPGVPGAGGGGGRPLRVWAPRALPQVGPAATVLFTTPEGKPAVAVYRYHGGRVVVLPADALSNARLGEAGNADLLETLLRNLGPRWAFDEVHHGLVTTHAARGPLGRAADLLLAHLVLLYLLAVLALARRQGPAWREPATVAGSAATFLLGMGALHHRLGHHAEAARLLLRRARELDRGLQLAPDLDRQAASAGPRELVEIATQVARRRAGDLRIEPGEPP
ncbi:MAG TPA: hypothetical protein VOA80_15530 [Thermoanaerobaculia bacterium]|nr:hypothetical protein [Thermoanaerobaculia bacterium]